VCQIQLDDDNDSFMIQRLTIEDFSLVIDLLTNPAVTKVLHSCSEDLEVFSTFLNCIPTPLIDTQIAAGLLNIGVAVGYANLIKTVSGVELAKDETRSNWLQRPLTPQQIQYAAQDVEFLLPVFYQLRDQLVKADRWPWLLEECDNLIATAKQPADLDEYYKRIKSAAKLTPQQLAILKPLSHWREVQARAQNKPRNHVIHEKALVEVARRQPSTANQLKQIDGLSPPKIRQYGDMLLQAVADVGKIDKTDLPEALPGPLTIAQRDLLKALKETANDIADRLELPAEVLAKKTDYEHIIRALRSPQDDGLSERMQGWRKTVIGEPLLAVARQFS